MKNGFSLLELMVVVLLTSVVMSAIFMVMSSGRSTWFEADAQVTVQQELRKALRAMKRDLTMSGPTQVSVEDDGAVDTSISFNVSLGALGSGAVNWSTTPINFSLSSGQLIRTQGANTKVLANNISSLTFLRSGASPRMLRFNTTVTKFTKANRNISVSQEASVYLRN